MKFLYVFLLVIFCVDFQFSYSSMVPITFVANMSVAFGAGASTGGVAGSFFGPVTFAGSVIVGGIFGVAKFLKDKSKEDDAQAPGKPTEKDGFFPPKNWDGKKQKHSINGKVGWPDKKGDLWVPTGPGPLAHGGPHWDVQSSDGRHKNVYPGGKVR